MGVACYGVAWRMYAVGVALVCGVEACGCGAVAWVWRGRCGVLVAYLWRIGGVCVRWVWRAVALGSVASVWSGRAEQTRYHDDMQRYPLRIHERMYIVFNRYSFDSLHNNCFGKLINDIQR